MKRHFPVHNTRKSKEGQKFNKKCALYDILKQTRIITNFKKHDNTRKDGHRSTDHEHY
jgi:hypothetical protein